MKLSMFNWMRIEPLEVTLKRLVKYGYQGITLVLEPYTDDFTQIRELLKKYDIKCWGAGCSMHGDRSLLAKDEEQRASSLQYAKDCVVLAKEIGAYKMIIVPATIGNIIPESTPENEWEWVVESMKELYEYSLKEGIRLAIEPLTRFETYFINRCEQALALAEAVGPECGVCLDTFHLNIEEPDPYQSIINAGSRLLDFHVSDTNRFAPGMGQYDWPRVISCLKKAGYDGALTAEFVVPIDRTPANPYPNALEKEPQNITPEQFEFIVEHGSNMISEEFYSWQAKKTAETLLPLIS
jgi:D-psicose/D-tagatose/L-ribulose 3-epimerase